MRIVIDMQGAQGGSRYRGIGRYTIALTQAIIRHRGDHEVFLALNGMVEGGIEPIRAIFDASLPQSNIRVWQADSPVAHLEPANDMRRESAELVREAFLASLKPDIVLISSLFEGLQGSAVTSIGLLTCNIPTAVILYDLIPFINRSVYLENPTVASWYDSKIDHLRRANLLFAISESSRQEGIGHLSFSEQECINISTAADSQFKPMKLEKDQEQTIRAQYGLTHEFLMYTGGIDPRKNIEGLICAYARLPKQIRAVRQLAIVCEIQSPARKALELLVADQGLEPNEVILTGFVSENDLIGLYNLCQAFIFPSWHEGFGLPALEAMSCGRAVIAANTSSLPEVVGCEDALFDPFDENAFTAKIYQVLTNENFRQKLEKHGLEQAKLFSWDESAHKFLTGLESWYKDKKNAPTIPFPHKRPKLAYVSPLPPERSGISDYSAELLPELARFYDIDVIVEQTTVNDYWVSANCSVRDSSWLRQHASSYDRVLYHFGNSNFHQHMFDLLKDVPGVVVLHDFFLSGIVRYMEFTNYKPHFWRRNLLLSHGYTAVHKSFKAADLDEVLWEYPTNAAVLQDALGVIVHADNSCRLACAWYGPSTADDWSVIPLLRTSVATIKKQEARAKLGLKEDDFVICSFGMLGIIKLNHRLVDAWFQSKLAKDKKCQLIFVGESPNDEYSSSLLHTVKGCDSRDRVKITGWNDTERFRLHLAAADLAVQLRTLSRGESSAAVLDCMNYGLPIIVNANGSMADLPDKGVYKLKDRFDDVDLIQALEQLWKDAALRQQLGATARQIILTQHNPRKCAIQYAQAIEQAYIRQSHTISGLLDAVANQKHPLQDAQGIVALSEAINRSIPSQVDCNQLFVDISVLVRVDAKSGIQRVVRSILQELLLSPPSGYSVQPVYANTENGYLYARKFTLDFLGSPSDFVIDEPISFKAGDIFLGLDLNPYVINQRSYYQLMRGFGVDIRFVVYDLLSITHSHYFEEGSAEQFNKWLEVYAECDGVICISKSVADEFWNWLQYEGIARERPFKIDWFHLGADMESSKPTTGMPKNAPTIKSAIAKHPSFLMVGTLEPRKGHRQVIAAFEALWRENIEVNLIIVGKQGWLMEETIYWLRRNPQLNRKLFWLENISDEFLEDLYKTCSCLIAASEGEGFGLPLIEAAQYKLPIIARDLPVFREVAGDNAIYFNGIDPEALAAKLKVWLSLAQSQANPNSENISWLTWKETTSKLFQILQTSKPYKTWMHDGVYRLWGSDKRVRIGVGMLIDRSIHSQSLEGPLFFGPYINLTAGDYVLVIDGEVGEHGLAGAYLDVAVRGGDVIFKHILDESPRSGQIITLTLKLANDYPSVEFRLWVSAQSDVRVDRLVLVPFQLQRKGNMVNWCGSDSRLPSQVGIKKDLIITTTGASGFLFYGNYLDLRAATYSVSMHGLFGDHISDRTYIDVVYGRGNTIIFKKNLKQLMISNEELFFEFDLSSRKFDIEIRLWVDAETSLSVSEVSINTSNVWNTVEKKDDSLVLKDDSPVLKKSMKSFFLKLLNM